MPSATPARVVRAPCSTAPTWRRCGISTRTTRCGGTCRRRPEWWCPSLSDRFEEPGARSPSRPASSSGGVSSSWCRSRRPSCSRRPDVTVDEALERAPSGSSAVTSASVRSVGVEEEFFLLWPDGSPAPIAPELLAMLPGDAHFHPEWMTFQVETVTSVCTDLASLHGELVAQRTALQRVAQSCAAEVVA